MADLSGVSMWRMNYEDEEIVLDEMGIEDIDWDDMDGFDLRDITMIRENDCTQHSDAADYKQKNILQCFVCNRRYQRPSYLKKHQDLCK